MLELTSLAYILYFFFPSSLLLFFFWGGLFFLGGGAKTRFAPHDWGRPPPPAPPPPLLSWRPINTGPYFEVTALTVGRLSFLKESLRAVTASEIGGGGGGGSREQYGRNAPQMRVSDALIV